MTNLTAIVIARNEEARIGACLDACLRAIDRSRTEGLIQKGDVILVDSASTDRTVEIARRFPVSIVHLPPDWPLSAAAGRFVGLRHARGDLVLFVDGDYVLFPEWLAPAIRTLQSDPAVAAVCGKDLEEATGDSLLMRYEKALVESLRGEPAAVPVGLYRRRALESVGGIHPFLRGAEDRDVAYRLRDAGLHLVRIDEDMGVHGWADRGALDFITYFRSVLAWSIGDGQVYRIRRGVRNLVADTRRRYLTVRHLVNYLLGLGLLALVLVNLSGLVIGPWVPLAADAFALAAFLGTGWAKSWGPRETVFRLHVFPYSLIRHAGFLAGFLHPPPEPSRYPKGERVVRVGQ